MIEQISFTIPVTPSALNRTITMLKGMADDLQSTPSLFDHVSITPHGIECAGQATTPYTYVAGEPTVAITPPTPSVGAVDTFAPSQDEPLSELDSQGVPWDFRIHAATKTRVANGTWKLKRGADADDVAEIIAEHLGNAVGQNPISETIVEPKVDVITEVAPPPPPPPPSAKVEITDYKSLVTAITANGIPLPRVLEVCSNNGIASLPLLQANVAMIPFIAAELGL